MKRYIAGILLVILWSTALYAGKNVSKPLTPVIPVSTPWPFYIGAGLVMTSLERDPCPCADSTGTISDHRNGGLLRFGWNYNPYLAIEFKAFQTVGGEVFSETEHYGIYLKPQYRFSERWKLYGLLGYGKTTIDYTNGILSSTTEYTGVTYGLGIEYILSTYTGAEQHGAWSLWADVQNLMNDEGAVHTTANVFSFGVGYSF